jgi:hypothetical protein
VDIDTSEDWNMPNNLWMVFVGCVGIYSALIGTGNLLYRNWTTGSILMGVFALASVLIWKNLERKKPKEDEFIS